MIMKKAIRHLIPFIVLITLFSSCNSVFFGEKIKGEGPVESELRSIDSRWVLKINPVVF